MLAVRLMCTLLWVLTAQDMRVRVHVRVYVHPRPSRTPSRTAYSAEAWLNRS